MSWKIICTGIFIAILRWPWLKADESPAKEEHDGPDDEFGIRAGVGYHPQFFIFNDSGFSQIIEIIKIKDKQRQSERRDDAEVNPQDQRDKRENVQHI